MSDPRLIVNYDKEELRKWDARGALLGHPGPSPPFGKFYIISNHYHITHTLPLRSHITAHCYARRG